MRLRLFFVFRGVDSGRRSNVRRVPVHIPKPSPIHRSSKPEPAFQATTTVHTPVPPWRMNRALHSLPIFVGKRRLWEMATGRFESASRGAPEPVRAAPGVNALPVSSWMVEIECL
jgi:hypothetical protein